MANPATRYALQRSRGIASGGHAPPNNPLLRALYEVERVTLGPTVGVIQEFIEREHPGIEPKPLWEAMYDGWKQAKTFNNIVEDPWLAFALNVGLDPITWIPGTWTTKFGKGVGKALGKGVQISGIQNWKYADEVMDVSNRTRHYLGKKFIRDYDWKRFPRAKIEDKDGSLVDIIRRYDDELEDFHARLSNDVQGVIKQGVPSDEEQRLLAMAIEMTPPGRNISLAAKEGKIHTIPQDVLDVYNRLSDSAKDTYKYAFKHRANLETLKESRGYLLREIMAGLEEKMGATYLPHVLGEWNKNLSYQNLQKAVNTKIRTGNLPTDTIIQIASDIPDAMKPLAELTVEISKLGDFRRAVTKLANNDPRKALFNVVEQDAALKVLKSGAKSFIKRIAKDKQAQDLWGYRMSEYIWNNPNSRLARAFKKKFPGRQVRRGEYFWGKKTKHSVRPGTAKHPAFPTNKDIEKLLTEEPQTPYKSIRDFFRQSREALTIKGVHLSEVLGKEVPEEFFAGYTRVLNAKSIKQLENMVDPADIPMLREINRKMSEQVFKGVGAYDPTKARKHLLRADEIAALNLYDIETRLGPIMGVEGATMAKAMARQNLVDRLLKWALKERYYITEEALKDPQLLAKWLMKTADHFGEDVMKQLVPTGPLKDFVKVNIKEFEGLRFPKLIAGEINRALAPVTDGQKMEGFFRVWKRVQDWWKAWTLAVFPQYHTRNLISNVYNNYLAGMGSNPLHFARDMQFYHKAMRLQYKFKMAKKLGKELIPEEARLIKEFQKYRITTGGEFVGEMGDIMRKYDFKPTDLADPRAHRNFFVQKGFAVGRAFEDNARIAHYLWARHGKGMSAKEAARSVHKYLFDYKRGLTPFETKYGRNFLFPFIAWTRFNLPLQIEMLIKQPGRIARVGKFIDAWENQWGGPEPEEAFQADWMKRAMSLRWKWNPRKGTYEYFMLDSWLPTAEVNKVLSVPLFRDMMVNLLSPISKIPVEIMWNYDLFKKRPLQEYEGQKVAIQYAPDKKVYMTPQIAHVFKHFRLINDVHRYLSSTDEISGSGRALRFILGKSFPYSPADQKVWMLKTLTSQKSSLEWRRDRSLAKGDYKQAANEQAAINMYLELIDDYQRR